MRTCILNVAACCLLASPARAADEMVTAKDMKLIGLAFYDFSIKNMNKKGPAKAEDLEAFLGDKKEEVKRLMDLLKTEKVKFIYNVGLLDMPDGSGSTVIAYEKDIAKNGGLALYGDGTAMKMTAAEFKKAILAKPKTKKDK